MNIAVNIPTENMWDPNTWNIEPVERRIYLDDKAELFCLVSEEDYLWAIQWRWQPKRHHKNRKIYACRTTRTSRSTGNFSVYLHIEIMKRTGILKPTVHHTLVDHRNGNERDARRPNLRWATRSMNNRNVYGRMPHDLLEG